MAGFFRNLINLFRDQNEVELEKIQPIVNRINELEPQMKQLTDAELRAKTDEFRARLKDGETLDDLLPEAFAVVREAAQRATPEKFRHYDVQLIGGIVLHQGKIAEMKTGEGKTLAATLPAYLNALPGKGVHIVTVNDYLAKRDAEWMGKIYEFLGLTVGVILNGMPPEERKKAYAADITYGTNNEFGFDYLRDNMAMSPDHLVQRELNYAIIDEVDSILIDEARTPLIISGPSEDSPELYYRFAKIVPRLKRDVDYTVDEKANSVAPTEEGIHKVEKILGVDNLYANEHMDLVHYLNQALRAYVLMKRDRDYVVSDGEVLIVDQFTGRIMPGRRYSDGLHQAIEAKEGVKIQRESQTLASITYQNYFRMYNKLAGMTGTAATEEEEFIKIYNLPVVVVPTNKPMIRKDLPDVIYKTERAKFKAVVEEIVKRHKKGQPVLVGTISIEKSEQLSDMLRKRGIPHQVLNAKYHAREAEIIKNAGQKGAVTIATNMAGRGTDIVLGEGVKELGGLHIIGTERHESRRIDNQLRGRAGRQGDPGSSQFFISLEDDLMRLFGSDNIYAIMDKLGMEEDMPIEHPLITKSIERAQKKVEGRNFEIRKYVLEYDNVLNKQREIIYSQRREILMADEIKDKVLGMMEKMLDDMLDIYLPEGVHPEDWDLKGLVTYWEQIFAEENMIKPEDLKDKTKEEIREYFWDIMNQLYDKREQTLTPEIMRRLEKQIALMIIDRKWMDHLDMMEDLRQGIGLRAYGQRDPLTEYKFESYELFKEMTESIRSDIIRTLFHIKVVTGDTQVKERRISHVSGNENTTNMALRQPGRVPQREMYTNKDEEVKRQPIVKGRKIGRNEPCPCGSGKKYKKCCGR
ncbi:preprotein translocase subunit SecA [Anoxybacter fermentans]|uniref:Protein translocase subunit SecA n=1 Tax=Anoxybacter fermentans TaxID=1323375 RepID=A0A3Q9HNT2_9FIRM|nr:preprotein translocase subunit SecA [Anoxybacter fermentans]AZR72189.1 preprotein translocase subunit SecA [Anoxybacter fermentans]